VLDNDIQMKFNVIIEIFIFTIIKVLIEYIKTCE